MSAPSWPNRPADRRTHPRRLPRRQRPAHHCRSRAAPHHPVPTLAPTRLPRAAHDRRRASRRANSRYLHGVGPTHQRRRRRRGGRGLPISDRPVASRHRERPPPRRHASRFGEVARNRRNHSRCLDADPRQYLPIMAHHQRAVPISAPKCQRTAQILDRDQDGPFTTTQSARQFV